MGIDLDVVKKWASEKYPFFMNNEDMLIRLYKREILNEVVDEKRQYFPSFTTIGELKDNTVVSLRVKLLETGTRKNYKGCLVCHKKDCLDTTHKGQEIITVVNGDIGDESGMLPTTFFLNNNNIEIFDKAFVFLVRGKKAKDKNGIDVFRQSGWLPLSEKETVAFNILYDFFLLQSTEAHKEVSTSKYETWSKAQENIAEIEKMEKYLITRKEKEQITPNIW